jgi:8-amino-7-oxononanoate synthase
VANSPLTSSEATSQPVPAVPSSGGDVRELIHATIVQWLRQEASLTIDRIDYDASLFELGIDSLGAATIGGQLEQLTGQALNPEVLFELQTINELAEYLESLRGVRRPVPETASSADSPHGSANPSAAAVTATGPGLLQRYARLNRRVHALKKEGKYFFEPEISHHDGAWVVVDGQRMLMLASYEYLGLLGHPHLRQSALDMIDRFGTGHHGARLLVGTTSVHRELERRLARFMQTDDAVVFSSGYVANLATISALVGPGDFVIGDQVNHASIMDGCRMSGATFWEFEHNNMDSLAQRLREADSHRTLVVVDAVFSMDGDIIDLPAVVGLCKQHGALLMVDEAHSVGVLGTTGHGIQEHYQLPADAIDVKMGTLSKTLAGSGGFVAGHRELTTYLRHHARGYIFSGALPAAQAGVSVAALDVVEQQPELVARLRVNTDRYLNGLKALGFDTGKSVTPIVPVMTRNDEITLEMTHICRGEGLLVIPVCYPAVPMDAPRLRTCVSAIQTFDDIDFALDVLARAGRRTGLIS